jgi:ankyrin repeat protein
MKKIMRLMKIVAITGALGLVVMLLLRWKLDDFGDPLLNAVYSGNIEKVVQLMETGADPNKSDSYGNTPLGLVVHQVLVDRLDDWIKAA